MAGQIVNQSNLNLAALSVDDVYVVIVPPGPAIIRGVPTNIAGIVGTAHGGPIDVAVRTGSGQEVLDMYGPITPGDPFDIPTAVSIAELAGAKDFRIVRVARQAPLVGNLAAAASCDIIATSLATAATVTPKDTGTFNNTVPDPSAGPVTPLTGLLIKIMPASNLLATHCNVSVQLNGSGLPKETYTNIIRATAPATDPGTFAFELNDAVVNGQSTLRPPSDLIESVVAGGGAISSVDDTDDDEQLDYTGRTSTMAHAFLGGVDGNPADGAEIAAMKSAVGASTLIGGANTNAAGNGPSGMFALERSGAFQFILFGHDDPSFWGQIANFAGDNGMLGIVGFAPGVETGAVGSAGTAVDLKSVNGLDTKDLMLVKDSVLWDDPVSKKRRAVPQEAVALGITASLSPEQGVGNKPVFGFPGTERTRDRRPYTNSEISVLEIAGINFITNPIPAGDNFGLRHNQNGSSDLTISGVNHTRMTGFLAQSFAQSLGRFIGKVQSTRPNDQLREDARATLTAFLSKLQQTPATGGTGMIDSFVVVLDETNNTPQTIGEGFLNANVAVRYLAVVRFFVIQLQGGQTVVTVSDTQPAGTQINV